MNSLPLSPLLLFSLALLLLAGCRATPGVIKYRTPVLDYERTEHPTSNIQHPTSNEAAPRAVIPPARTWTATWSPWSCPVPALIKIYWSSNLSGPWIIAGTFARTNFTGQLLTPHADNNFFRTGYTITP